MDLAHPTPYPDVNALLRAVLVGAQQRLGPHFVGMYLEGSLVSDDFDQDSDIDFVVVTSDDLSPEQFTAVQLMHDHIATRHRGMPTSLKASTSRSRPCAAMTRRIP